MNRLRNVGVAVAAPLLAIAFSLAVTSLVIEISGGSAGDFIGIIFSWPADRILVNIVNQTSLIYLSALAAAVGFRMNLFNIGVEGQYYLAGILATTVHLANGLFAATAARRGDRALAAFLGSLEPVLLELANQTRDAGIQLDQEGMRDVVRDADLLFQVRAVEAGLRAAERQRV